MNINIQSIVGIHLNIWGWWLGVRSEVKIEKNVIFIEMTVKMKIDMISQKGGWH